MDKNGNKAKRNMSLIEKDKIKYICLDLDGTLLNTEKQIPDSALNSILKLKNKGIKVVLISGRHIETIMPYAEQLKLGEDDYIISADGMYIYNGAFKPVWESNFLSIKDIRYIIKNFKDKVSSVVTDLHDYKIYTSFFKKFRKPKINPNNPHKVSVGYRRFRLKNEVCERIFICCKMGDVKLKNISVNYNMVTDNDNVSRSIIMPLGVSKFNALSRLCKTLGDIPENFLYFGDSYNDVEVFEKFKNTVAMGNSVEEVKKAAAFITETNDNDGISFAIKELFGLK